MKIAGIIAEYNPFHNGHRYHIEETRQRTGADYVIAVISGNFVQRGAPALINKYDRARMALLYGADLVFELPLVGALSSAEGFAMSGVSLLTRLGVVDTVSCGCKNAASNPDLLSRVADFLCEEPPVYRETLKSLLSSGMSFPKARDTAVYQCLQIDTGTLLTDPNDILALEYTRAIRKTGSSLDLCLIPRQGSAHNDSTINGTFSSASAIRNAVLSEEETDLSAALQGTVPADIADYLTQAGKDRFYLMDDDLSDLLFFALTEKKQHLDEFGPENPDLARRTAQLAEQFTDWTEFTSFLKTKNQTYTAVSRFLTHILLDLKREEFVLAARYHNAPYARLLGYRSGAASLIGTVCEHADIPVLTQLSKEYPALDDSRRHLLDLDLAASEIYRYILYTRSGSRLKPEFRQPLLSVP